MSEKPRAKASSPSANLDELLPLLTPEQVELHRNAAVLEVDEPVRLLELARDPAIRGLLLCRLSPTVALIDCRQADALVEIMRKRGHMPRLDRG